MNISCMITSIGLYLDPKDVFLSLSLVCKEWHIELSGNYIGFWLKSYLSLKTPFSLEDAKRNISKLFKQEILRFNPWISTGGMSPYEYGNSFQNMWNYNGLPYSSYYARQSPGPFKKNLNCVAYYGGGFQSHYFYDSGHYDWYCTFQQGNLPIELLDFENNNKLDMLTLAPLFPEENIIDLDEQASVPKPWDPQIDFKSGRINGKIQFPYNPCRTELAFVNKIAIARPLYFTAPIRTVVIFFSQSDSEEINLDRFDIANNLVSIEDAKLLGIVDKEVNEEKIKYLEFKKRDEEWYPAIWIQFQTWKLSHFEIDLQRIHQVERVMVKLIDADDCRDKYEAEWMDPNYDILYCLFLGTSIAKEDSEEAEDKEEIYEIDSNEFILS
ncbi:unnamed protein product [Blepharisma stoltei]|uniref:F-box domain-containing protein n=1 Tax=Blepharisma stoltei TaxID=1481888 RepID=A0AAU9K967_9CILI|nr:unnamed protein product [Blepharisma stoltei]